MITAMHHIGNCQIGEGQFEWVEDKAGGLLVAISAHLIFHFLDRGMMQAQIQRWANTKTKEIRALLYQSVHNILAFILTAVGGHNDSQIQF